MFPFIFLKNFWRIMYFNFKNRIFINKIFVILPLIAFKNVYFIYYFYTFIFALFHELAHFFAAFLQGEKTGCIFINPYGFELKFFTAAFKNEFAIIFAGPLLNFILWAFFLIFREYTFAKINFTIGALNLIPALPLDGGRLLNIIIRKKCGILKSHIIMKRISFCISLIFAIFSFIHFNIWTLIIASLIFLRNK